MAAMTHGEQLLSFSASRRASPSLASSAWLRKRSRLPSRYFSTCRQGLEPSGLRPCFSAHPKNLESSASVRLAWYGLLAQLVMQTRNVLAL